MRQQHGIRTRPAAHIQQARRIREIQKMQDAPRHAKRAVVHPQHEAARLFRVAAEMIGGWHSGRIGADSLYQFAPRLVLPRAPANGIPQIAGTIRHKERGGIGRVGIRVRAVVFLLAQ